ncbi:bifunctional 3'-5' exonuclease/DNA polymerase [Phytoactinopolyspora halotolerans]|uniref:DNA-directed DNA polymerase n=1 Tax=Phytoactinopolyspora halotolerans TaxID=1981512 RepID=A0A6L9SJY3_9ACTN|nr:bifunctional 3'-5' exonuclease/DNA polymerase [Phytoactinopolyspora halotolerans]NEE04380.1 bifunctional 3'-5' exonuclease/DNA polymerase [Phytoactinopolyspora halotolerans]
MQPVVVPEPGDTVRVVDVRAFGDEQQVRAAVLACVVREAEAASAVKPRWTWDDTNRWYPALLTAGVRIERAHDLRLAHRILRRSALATWPEPAGTPAGPWGQMMPAPLAAATTTPAADAPAALFAGVEPATQTPGPDPVAELHIQNAAVEGSSAAGRLRLLLAAESAGALVAVEMHHAGLPWRADIHDAILTEILGPRPRAGERPARLERLAERIRDALEAPPSLNPDSPRDLLKAMDLAGVGARSLRKWELERLDHPVIEPLLEYKSLYRMLTASGWTWLDAWVRGGRFRSEYVVGGVVTGRWASSGGGALQLPKNVRRAVVADPGWTFVVADAAQLEPRVLAGMAGDEAMAAAGRGADGRGADMYAGIVASGAVETRELAKVGMLGALYGGTTGSSGQVLPRLARAFPRSLAFVDEAARAGERGEIVTTHLGRSSPPPGEAWHEAQSGAYLEENGDGEAAKARSYSRSWGRFTRNFVVQGTAAEWAMCWMASIRRRLWALGEAPEAPQGPVPDPFAARPHLVLFLHDEVVVHTPVSMAEAVADEVRAAAAEAGRLLFGDFPVQFPLSVAVADCYADAK